MRRYLAVGVLACLAGGPAVALVEAQRPAARFPVIVVLRDDVSFPAEAGRFLADDRVRANPTAWRYLDPGVAGAVQSLEAVHGFRAQHVYSAALRGFSARLSAQQIEALENDGWVRYVEADGPMHVVVQSIPWGIDKVDADLSSTRAGDGAGAVGNVNVYIIDTGVATHADLNRVRHVNFDLLPLNDDCHGHGTHVAGTVAARDNTSSVVGVAPGAPITGVKVLGCTGSGLTSAVIKGVDWVTANAVKPAVANMSLGGGASAALDDAVRRSAQSGVFYALAAGNDGADACNTSPARAGAGTNNGILTVAATDINDKEASFSNYGTCVDIWAPGVDVLSTFLAGGTATFSGTSMASPHGAGGGALYLSGNTTASPSTVEAVLKQRATVTANKSKDGRTITRENVSTF